MSLKNIAKYISTIDLLVIALSLASLPLFFYKLGQSSLVSWDEAWYADISRHIAQTGDLFNLIYNGQLFYDHPMGGFWITALFFKLFGISEFTARLSAALCGYLAIIVTYFLGKLLFNRIVGFCSGLSLLSAFWFLYRSRAGDLDTPLTLFFILTILLSLKAVKNRRFFWPFSLSLAFLMLIKTSLPFAVLPVLVVIFWRSKNYQLKDFIWPTSLIVLLLGVWLLLQGLKNPTYLFLNISRSIRGASISNDISRSFQHFITYLHNGLGKWFWPGVVGLSMGLLLRQKRFLILITFILSYSIPFLFLPQVQIWHLIPLYPFLILSFYGAVWVIAQKLTPQKLRPIIPLTLILFASYYSFIQLKAAWVQFIDIPAFVSDEAILSREAGKYPDPLFLDGDFDPAGTFYADKPVTKLRQSLPDLFRKSEKFLLITNQWRLQEASISPQLYQLIKTDRDKVLILKL